jgi:hypothetical protein
LKAADGEDGVRPGVTAAESAELRELKKRNQVLEQENEILRRAPAFSLVMRSQKMYVLVRDLAVDGIPVTLACRVVGFSTQAVSKSRANSATDRDWDDTHVRLGIPVALAEAPPGNAPCSCGSAASPSCAAGGSRHGGGAGFRDRPGGSGVLW